MQNLATAVKLVALASYLALALLTLRSAAAPRIRAFFSIYLFGMLLWQAGSAGVNFAHDAGTALTLYNLMLAFSGLYTILFFPFTRALLDIKGQRAQAALAYLVCAVQFVSGLAGLQLDEVVLGRSGYWVPVYSSRLMYALSGLSFLFWGLGFANLVRALRGNPTPVQRNRIRYILIGAAVTIIGAATNLTALRDYPVDITANLASAAIIGYAVVRHRLLDLRAVIARSLIYSVLTATLVGLYLGFIFGLEGLLSRGGAYSSRVYGAIAIVILAGLFLPLRNLLQRILDRVFFRERGEYQKALELFSRELASLYDAEPIADLVCRVVGQGIKPGFAAFLTLDPATERYRVLCTAGPERPDTDILVLDPASPLALLLRSRRSPVLREDVQLDPALGSALADSGSPFALGSVALVAPVTLEDRMPALIALGQKRSGAIYGPEDLSFLSTIASQAATALDRSDIFLGIRRRLSEQTLLFVLSEKFRDVSDFPAVMDSVTGVLADFLDREHCAIAWFESGGATRLFARGRLGFAAGEALAAVRPLLEIADARPGAGMDLRTLALESLRSRGVLGPEDVAAAEAFAWVPLGDPDSRLGVLAVSGRRSGGPYDERDDEIFAAVRSIVSQGMALHRSIVTLTNMERYNERILGSLDDMGDTLLVVDAGFRIERASEAAARLLGRPIAELEGLSFGRVIDAEDELADRKAFFRLLESGPLSNREARYRTSQGSLVPMLLSASLMPSESGERPRAVIVARDITERRKAEESAKNLLMVQEIHHRIKNNLQVISSLLALQSHYVEDEAIQEMFRESRNRVRSMALLHEKLYQSQTPSRIDFGEYLGDLAEALLGTYSNESGKVDVRVDVAGIELGMDSAVPCGLLVGELVSNAFKHAFPDGREGRVVIRLRELPQVAAEEAGGGAAPGGSAAARTGAPERRFRLEIEDDGIGFACPTDLRNIRTLGLKIVWTLAAQLHGSVRVEDAAPGSRFVIDFVERQGRLARTSPGL
ncbi:MAG TPA: histidine kinase dimerization/phosphoacceptor domain -containing protein [Spirochaetales bacterium]|nr:histidine kinase dimerization/phosphoacceptor domain -containing protein [Spirochaetales bacterium]